MDKKTKFISVCLSVLMGSFLLTAWFLVDYNRWGDVCIFITCTLIVTILFSAHIITSRIETKIEQLEELLKQNFKKGEEKESKQ